MQNFIASIADLTKFVNHPSPKHPSLGLAQIENIREKIVMMPSNISFGFYTIGLKKNLKGYLKYGRKEYDFQEGVLIFTAPFQVMSYDNLIIDESEGWYLFFDNSFLSNSKLAGHIERFKFFSYSTNEALHLSKEEENHLNSIFQSLFDEYNKPIDTLSKQLLINHLEMILTYSERYYKRQFITRNDVESDFLIRFEQVLHSACHPNRLPQSGIPSVKYIAQQMHLSPSYLSDALRNATGMGTQKLIHLRLINLAKEQLLNQNQSVSEVAYSLGFESHAYFSRLFKKVEGISPKEFMKLS